MTDLRKQRLGLLKKLLENGVDWKADDEAAPPNYPNSPPSDFFVDLGEIVIDLGKSVRKTETGPRQQYFIRIVRGTTLVDLFFENDLPSMFSDIMSQIYEKATNAVVGVDAAYDYIFNKLD